MTFKSWIAPLAWAALGAAVVGGCGADTGSSQETAKAPVRSESKTSPTGSVAFVVGPPLSAHADEN